MRSYKFKKFITLILEPFAFGLLALLFIIPSITVINLEPITKALKEFDVLGVSDDSEIQINVVGGTHQIFNREKIESIDGVYTYTTFFTRREADRYSKPVLEIVNKKSEEVILEIYGYTTLPTRSDITMIISNQVYRLQGSNGDVKTNKITVLPGQKYVVFLAIESFSNVQFEEEFQLFIKEIQY